MGFTLRVHEYGKVPNSPFTKIIKSNHYIRLSHQGQPPIYIQNGHLWSEGGDRITNPPEWFHEQIKSVDKKQLAAVKYEAEAPKPRGRPKKEDVSGDD